jgi:ABC-type amino acid transport substrate-binding protein/cytochrome c5
MFSRARRQAALACLRASLLGAAMLLASRAGFAAEPLRLCADPANLPFSSDRAATPGLYVEIGRALAEAMGRPSDVVWSLTYFGKRNLRQTLLAGQCDAAVGLPDDADFMGPRVIFSRPILDLGYALVVPKDMAFARLDDLRGRRVAVQFATPPQSLLAERDDVTLVTVLDPETGMRRLAAHEADAAFIWGPSAGYINRTDLHDAYRVIPVAGPGMQWHAAIGFDRKQTQLRDDADAALARLGDRIAALAEKYALPGGAPVQVGEAGDARETKRVLVTDDSAPPAPQTAASSSPMPAASEAMSADAAAGQKIFNGTCGHCHGPDAVQSERRINLRLLRHRYGDNMDEVFLTTVTNGRPAKGMPVWKGVFTEDDFSKILAFLKTVQDN